MNRFDGCRRVVIKIGTTTLTHGGGFINHRRMEGLVKTIADIKNSGRQVVIVSSGAVGVGMGELGLKARPDDIPTKQACAAVGQCELMHLYDKLFSEYHHSVAQVLLTHDIIEDEARKKNVINTFDRLLEFGVIPIVNENDTVATDELCFGDNDTLSAMVSVLIGADLLVLLSDIDGLYTADPKADPNASLIPVVEDVDSVMSMGGGSRSIFGSGGMSTKLTAAKLVCLNGIDMAIINGQRPQNLYDMFDGVPTGTLFVSNKGEV